MQKQSASLFLFLKYASSTVVLSHASLKLPTTAQPSTTGIQQNEILINISVLSHHQDWILLDYIWTRCSAQKLINPHDGPRAKY